MKALVEDSNVPGRKEIIEQFGISEDDFNSLYLSYWLALSASEETRNWNDDIDDFARELGAVSEQEIKVAQKDMHQAVLNRIKVRLVADGVVLTDRATRASSPQV
jgi:hypothetical protein